MVYVALMGKSYTLTLMATILKFNRMDLEERLIQVEDTVRMIGLNTKEVLTFDEVARFTGLSKSYLYKLTSSKRIPHYKPTGKLCYFNREEVEAWLQENRISTDEEISQKAQIYCMKKGGLK